VAAGGGVCCASRHSLFSFKTTAEAELRHCRPEELPSPIDAPTDSGRGPPAMLADTHVATRRPVSNVSSHSSRSSLLHKAAMNEVRRAFFTSTSSSSSLADGAVRSRTSIKDSGEPIHTSQRQKFADPVSDRSLSILWLDSLFLY